MSTNQFIAYEKQNNDATILTQAKALLSASFASREHHLPGF